MLPAFPQFKNLELSDKADIEAITSKYPPYSDFNFVSMWSWDTKGEMRISELNKNLVVRFTDYLTGEPFYSFLGDHKVNDTVKTLLEFSRKEGLKSKLKLVPEASLKHIDRDKFLILEEPDHFDYIYPINSLATFIGSEYKKHRKMFSRFKKEHKSSVKVLDLSDAKNQKLLFELVNSWINKKKDRADLMSNYKELEDLKNESIAFKKLFSAPSDFLRSLVCMAFFIDDILKGFIVSEKVSKDHCLSHFGKADTSYEGINQFIMQEHAKVFLDLGISYHNDEQDLGLPNLRFSKNSYRPTNFLKKHTIALMDDFVI